MRDMQTAKSKSTGYVTKANKWHTCQRELRTLFSPTYDKNCFPDELSDYSSKKQAIFFSAALTLMAYFQLQPANQWANLPERHCLFLFIF